MHRLAACAAFIVLGIAGIPAQASHTTAFWGEGTIPVLCGEYRLQLHVVREPDGWAAYGTLTFCESLASLVAWRLEGDEHEGMRTPPGPPTDSGFALAPFVFQPSTGLASAFTSGMEHCSEAGCLQGSFEGQTLGASPSPGASGTHEPRLARQAS